MPGLNAKTGFVRTGGYFVAWCALLVASASLFIHLENARRQNISTAQVSARQKMELDLKIPELIQGVRQCAVENLNRKVLDKQRSEGSGRMSLKGDRTASAARLFDHYPDLPPWQSTMPLAELVCPAAGKNGERIFKPDVLRTPPRFSPWEYSKMSSATNGFVRISLSAPPGDEQAAGLLKGWAARQAIRNADGSVSENPLIIIEATESKTFLHIYLERSP